MWKSGVIALLAAAVFSPCMAHADEFEQGMNTMWEVLWHQSGTPTRLVRWEQDIKVRVYGTNVAAHKQHALTALRAAAGEAGVKVIDVTDRPDAAQLANVSIEITPDAALSDNQPCETRLNFRTEDKLDSVTMQMRDSEERRCAYHESMHVMGVRGHPDGETVLSYFTTHTEGLLPLDKAMLRAWYSPRARGGMTPFEFLPIMADELVKLMPDRNLAKLERDRFLTDTIQQMQAFADGQGDVPAIVKRCGKVTPEAVHYGRMEMSYFLAVAFQKGTTAPQDIALAERWLQRAADMGSRPAQARLGAGGFNAAAGSN